MIERCSDDCEPLCDFCRNFEEFIEIENWYADGICIITGEEISRIDACEDNFHCFRCKEDNKYE